MIHQHENNPDTESFLKSNGKKFTGDCLIAMKLMYQGKRLSSLDCWNTYQIHDRRLRNCYAARPDIVQREWIYKDGKKSHVEYFITTPKVYSTKKELQEFWDEYQNELPLEKPSTSETNRNSYPMKLGRVVQGNFFYDDED